MMMTLIVVVLVFAAIVLFGFIALELTNGSNKRIAAVAAGTGGGGKISSAKRKEALRDRLKELEEGGIKQTKFYDLKTKAEQAGVGDKFGLFLLIGGGIGGGLFLLPAMIGLPIFLGLIIGLIAAFLVPFF